MTHLVAESIKEKEMVLRVHVWRDISLVGIDSRPA